jgi:hypothetical protein
MLRKIWPTPFGVKKGDIVSLIVHGLIFLIVCGVVGWLIGVLANIPLFGWIFGIIGGLMEAYSVIGLILCILKFFGVVS